MDVNENAPDPAENKASRAEMSFVRSGLAYIDRYGGPRARVLRTLERRARRLELEEDEARRLIAGAMHRIDALGVLDDRLYAESKARGLRRRGTSRRAALAKLAQTGIDRETAAAALDAVDDTEDREATERAAAERYAERRRLGPWRLDGEQRAARRDRDVAAMARAGFPVGLAISVIDGELDEDL